MGATGPRSAVVFLVEHRLLASFTALCVVVLIWLANVSRVGHPLGCPETCATATWSSDRSVRLVSLNMLHGFPHFETLPSRLNLLAGEILRLKADVVALQEVPWTLRTGNAAKHLASQLGFNYVYARANGNRFAIGFEEGEAILSRFPLSNTTAHVLAPQAAPFENRIVLHATVAPTDAPPLDLYVTHLTNGNLNDNARQAASLFDYLVTSQRYPALIAGDFNAQDDTPQIAMLRRTWLDAGTMQDDVAPPATCCVDDLEEVGEQRFTRRIDYIFLAGLGGDGWDVSSQGRVFDEPFQTADGSQWVSDHAGLLVELRFSDPDAGH